MANFEIALKITGGNEGGYANNPADSGGETYAGISRNNWPDWVGWKLIDSTISRNDNITTIDGDLRQNATLQSLIPQFYKANFWDVNKLDAINDQQIANSVYDMGVNSGTGYAARVLQRAAGVIADGIVGDKTISAVNEDDPESIYNSIYNQREARYKELAVGNQAQFLKSWLSRLTPYHVS